jgi:peptide/nickel transport system permease protein
VFVQYGRWLGGAARLDFGKSLISGDKVVDEITNRLPVTISITLGAMVVGLVLGIPLGIAAGARNGGALDRILLVATSAALSIPNFVLGLVLINFFAIRLGWFDAIGFNRLTSHGGVQVIPWLKSLTLPALALGVGVAARLARQVRAGIVDTLQEPYVRTAWAKGCRPITVIGKHVFKNAAIPTVTIFGLLFGGLLGGTVIIESLFAAPGLGDYLVRSVTTGDLAAIQALTVMFVLVYVVVNLLVDITYGWLNPRISMS